MNLKDALPVLQGIADGKPWQFRQNGFTAWLDSSATSMDPLRWACGDSEIRLRPWTLPPPPAGKQWHRDDFTEDMLPDGRRPLLLGEMPGAGDEIFFPDTTWSTLALLREMASETHHKHRRTRRPLPVDPPAPVMVPLEACDVPPGSALRCLKGQPGVSWWIVQQTHTNGVHLRGELLSWNDLRTCDFEILRPGSPWMKCEKEAKP